MTSVPFRGCLIPDCGLRRGNAQDVHNTATSRMTSALCALHPLTLPNMVSSITCRSSAWLSTRIHNCNEVNAGRVRDPQLDPEQHRRRGLEPSFVTQQPQSNLIPSPQATQQPQQPAPLLSLSLSSPSRQRHHHQPQSRQHQRKRDTDQQLAASGRLPVVQAHGRLNKCRRTAVGSLLSAPGIPEPGTVQDQSSCILLLLRRRRWRRSSVAISHHPAAGRPPLDAPDGAALIDPQVVVVATTTTAAAASNGGGEAVDGGPDDSAGRTDAGGGVQGVGASGVERWRAKRQHEDRDEYLDNAAGGYSTVAMTTTTMVMGPDGRAAHRTPRAIRTTAATTPMAMAAMVTRQQERRRLQAQQGQKQQEQSAVLVPLWEGQAWIQPSRGSLVTYGSESPYAAVSERHSNSSWRKSPTLPDVQPVATTTVPSGKSAGGAQGEVAGLGEEGASGPFSAGNDMLTVIGTRRQRRRRLGMQDSGAHVHALQLTRTEARPESKGEEDGEVTVLGATGAASGAPLRVSGIGVARDVAQTATDGEAVRKMEPVEIATSASPHSPGNNKSQWRAAASAVSVALEGEVERKDNRATFLARLSATAPGISSIVRGTAGGCCSSTLEPALLPSPTRAPTITTALAANAAGTRARAAGNQGAPGSGGGGSGGGGSGEACPTRRLETVKEEERDDVRRSNASAFCGGSNGVSVGTSDAAATARRLMRAVLACRHWRQLSVLMDEYSTSFNVLHLTAALGNVSRMQLPSPSTSSLHPLRLTRRAAAGTERSRAGHFDGFEGEAAEVHDLLSRLEAAFRSQLEAACARGAQVYSIEPCLGPRQLATSLAALARLRSDGWRVARDAALLQGATEVSAVWGLKSLPPQELTTLVYAFAKLDHYPGRVWMDSACAAGGGAAASRRMSPRQLSTFLWALATLRHPPGQVFMAAWIQGAVRAMARFSAYDISQALWALATLHRSQPPQAHMMVTVTATAAAVAESAPPTEAAAPPHGLPEVFVNAALGRAKAALHRPGSGSSGCAPQDICNTLWAVSQLQLAPPQQWVAAVAAALMASPDATLERCHPADLAGLLWALAKLTPDAPPPRGAMLRVLRAVARLEGRCGEQDLANVFWALGVFRFRPPQPVMRTLGLRLLKLSVEGNAGPQLLATALWCCVRLHLPPHPVMLRHLLMAAARRAPEFDPRSAPLLLYSLARLHHLGWWPLEDWQPLRVEQQQQQRRPVPHATEADPPAAAGAWPAATSPLPSRNKGATTTEAEGTEVGTTAASVASPSLPLDIRPFLDAALRGMAEVEMEGGRPRLALPVLLWSVAKLGHPPDEGWTRAYLAHSFEVLPMLSPAEASLVVSALLNLGQLPPPLWLDRMEHLTARRWGPAAEREVAELQKQAASLGRRATAAAAAAAAAATAPLAAPSDEALESTPPAQTVDVLSAPASTIPAGSDLWRLRQVQRRRQVAARVLGKRLEWCKARLVMLRHSMFRLRRGLAYLRARVRQQQQRHDSIMAAVVKDTPVKTVAVARTEAGGNRYA